MIKMKKSGHKLDYVVQIINYVYFVSREAVYDLHFPILRFRIPPPPLPYEIVTFRMNCMMLHAVCITVTPNLPVRRMT